MSQDRFFRLLERAPRIKGLWVKEKRELLVDQFESQLCVMSSGEIQMAKFFASIWFHDNKRYGFDIVDAVASIDKEERDIIIEWLNSPFYP